MAYSATIVPVMIASPGDVSAERDIVREVIHDWNDVNAASAGVMLSPRGWDTHASPELGTRAQDLINTRVLRDCDLLIGVFWTRLGTPTGKADSGTVEEVEEHIAAGKPAMIYFSSKPVAPESIDAEQYRKVKDFRDRCRSRGLIESFDSENEFRQKLSKQLAICIANNPYIRTLLKSDASSVAISPTADPEGTSISLSADAAALLAAAAEEKDGTILKLVYLSGKHIQAGSKRFGDGSNREYAKWEGVLENLISEGLVVGRGYKDQVFELTHAGWQVADAL